MKKVRIIKGVYGYRPAPGKSTQPIYMGKTVDLPDAEADRLVGIKVAEYVTNTAPKTATPPVVTPPAAPGGDGAGADTPPDESGAEGQETGESETPERPEYNADMKVDELRALMEEAGLQFRVGMKKADMVAALDAFYDGGEDDGDGPPNLQPEAPVT